MTASEAMYVAASVPLDSAQQSSAGMADISWAGAGTMTGPLDGGPCVAHHGDQVVAMQSMSHTINPWFSKMAEAALRSGHSPEEEPPAMCLSNTAEKAWWAKNNPTVPPPPAVQGPNINALKQQNDPWKEGPISAKERRLLEEPTAVIE